MQVVLTVHDRIQYEEGSWMIYDGNGKRASTNGTWLFIDKSYDLRKNTEFKAEEILFKASIIK